MAFVKIGKVSEVEPGRVKVYEVGDRYVAVCNVSGNFYAVDDICTHDEGSLDQGDPRHMARFDVRTGEVKALPAVVPIDVFEVRIDGDDIEVDV